MQTERHLELIGETLEEGTEKLDSTFGFAPTTLGGHGRWQVEQLREEVIDRVLGVVERTLDAPRVARMKGNMPLLDYY